MAPHVALLPSAGMGHLTPFCRLAAALVAHGCSVSLIVIHPMVSSAEAQHIAELLSAFPKIHPLELHVEPIDASGDPFYLQFEAIRRSTHLLLPLLSAASSRISALIIDMTLASAVLPVTCSDGLPSYILFTSSAAMLSLCAYFPSYQSSKTTNTLSDIHIPGLPPLPKASVPPVLNDPNHMFTRQFVENGRGFTQAHGILTNTFQALEEEALTALNKGLVVPGLPPVIPIGPLKPLKLKESSPSPSLLWLNGQPERSVVYVSFGSRTSMPVEQIKELGFGLEQSGHRFLWVIKTKTVDRDESAELEELLGREYLERVKERAFVMQGWVEQEKVLRHRAVAGFVSHCGWNSVTEAVLAGLRVLAWPQMGDQKVNAGVVKRSGLGLWAEEWGWNGEETVVRREDVAERVKEVIGSAGLRASAASVAAEAAAAVGDGGSTYKSLSEFVAKLSK